MYGKSEHLFPSRNTIGNSMQWTPTDQFGNLNIGVSSAQSLDELRPDLESLIVELKDRAGEDFKVTVDLEYAEINGPDPERVSHILQVAWLEGQSPEIAEQIESLVREIRNAS